MASAGEQSRKLKDCRVSDIARSFPNEQAITETFDGEREAVTAEDPRIALVGNQAESTSARVCCIAVGQYTIAWPQHSVA